MQWRASTLLTLLVTAVTFCGGLKLATAEEPTSEKKRSDELLVISVEAPYFKSGARKGDPPLGTFRAGTRVTAAQRIKGFIFVESADGRRGWIADSAVVEPDNPGSISPQAYNEFACDLYRLAAAPPGNAFLSPISVESVLGLLLAGAHGKTHTEIAKVTHLLDESESDTRATFWALLNRSGKGYELTCANHLWGARGVRFTEAFRDRTRKEYGAELTVVDFAMATAVRKQIDDWVSTQTKGKIPRIISDPLDPATTTLVATNATYFKGVWRWEKGEKGFLKENTKEHDFFVSGQQQVKVPMMSATLTSAFAELDWLQIVELPYEGGEFSAVILLPRQRDGIASLEKQLTGENLQAWFGKLKTRKVNVNLPRFRLSQSLKLNAILSTLGMRSAFNAEADFSMMADRPVHVSQIAHAAVIEVNEEGTVAAGATAGVVGASIPAVLLADHPFLFLIRDARHGFILFMGRVSNPGNDKRT